MTGGGSASGHASVGFGPSVTGICGFTSDYTYSGDWSGTSLAPTGTDTVTDTTLFSDGSTVATTYSRSTPGFYDGSAPGAGSFGPCALTYTDFVNGGTPCFAAGTQVVISVDAQGHATTRNIEDIQVGDWVLTRSQDDSTAPLEQRQVTAVSVTTVTRLRLLDIQEADGTSETIRTTDEHPFWVKDVGWVKAQDLQAGQELLTPDGRQATVLDSSVEA